MMAQFEIPGHLYYFSTDFPTKQHAIEFSPYFVYIDQKKEGKEIFIPFTQYHSLTRYYLQAIKKKN